MTFSSTISIPFRRCEVSMAWFCFAVASSVAFATASCDLMVKLLKFMILSVPNLVVRNFLFAMGYCASSCSNSLPVRTLEEIRIYERGWSSSSSRFVKRGLRRKPEQKQGLHGRGQVKDRIGGGEGRGCFKYSGRSLKIF